VVDTASQPLERSIELVLDYVAQNFATQLTL
jgi:hypothetical protein